MTSGFVRLGGPDLDTEWLFYAIADGSNVSRCHAVCDSCGADWYADGGSWRFTANHARGDLDFRDARRVADNTIMCPEPLCLTGRVSFTVG